MLKAGRALTGVSIGIAHIEAGDHSMIDILKRADLALYIAKDIPGSSHVFHTEGLGRFMQAQMAFEHEIALALENGDFFLEYQPIVGAIDNDIQSFEALVRWRHAERGVIFPEHFLPMAARAGHIAAVGRWVVAQAIMDATSWPEHIGLAINASAEELRDPGFAANISDCLTSSGLLASRLTIEITESTLAADIGTIGAGLAGLRDLGVRIALDDFGIGLSSINLLRQFPIDRLKIDRSFTHAMLDGGREGDLIDIIVKLGRAYNMPTTVEGVENERQMHMALSLGAAAVQGYLISQPVPAGAIQQLLVAANGMGEAKPEIRISA
jgi:EAL domain-containing protein (putative c-di-GMP-specific phosphodiesterase class I)